jgi:hypothetical protein
LSGKRSYDYQHKSLRRRLAPAVAAGHYDCARCGQKINPGEAWTLGHHPTDRGRYIGPEHRRCGSNTLEERAHAASLRPKPESSEKRLWSRVWYEPVPDDVVVLPDLAAGHSRS